MFLNLWTPVLHLEKTRFQSTNWHATNLHIRPIWPYISPTYLKWVITLLLILQACAYDRLSTPTATPRWKCGLSLMIPYLSVSPAEDVHFWRKYDFVPRLISLIIDTPTRRHWARMFVWRYDHLRYRTVVSWQFVHRNTSFSTNASALAMQFLDAVEGVYSKSRRSWAHSKVYAGCSFS